jgi:hypothetical protein
MSNIRGKWFGTLDQFSHDIDDTVPVGLTVDTISGDEFTGTMTWPSFNGCKAAVQGMLHGDLIKWIETDYLEGDDVVLYGLYVARLGADDALSGDWMDPKHTINPAGPNFGVPGASFNLKRE